MSLDEVSKTPVWRLGWRLKFDSCVPDETRDWIGQNIRALDDGTLPCDTVAALCSVPEPDRDADWGSAQTLMVCGSPVLLWQANGRFLLRSKVGGCEMDLPFGGPARIRFWGGRENLALYIAVHEAFRARGWVCLHGAASVPNEGKRGARLFIGRSGAGKSVRVLRAIRAGEAPMAEDRVWFEPAGSRLVAVDDSVRLLPDTLTRFPWLRELGGELRPDGKREFPFGAFGRASAAPALLRSCSIVRPRAQLRRVDELQTIWEAVSIPFSGQGRQCAEQAVAELLQRLVPDDLPEAIVD